MFGSAMPHFDELQALLDELAEAAEAGRGVELTPNMVHVLMSAIEAQLSIDVGPHANSPEHRFTIVMATVDREGPVIVLGATSLIEVARVILTGAAKQMPDREIRIYDGSVVVERSG
jgi:hypothetical protein